MSTVTISRVSIFDQLCDAVDIARELARENPARLARISDAWDWILEQEEFRFDQEGRLLFESRSEAGVIRHADGRFCDCPSRCACTHNEAASLIGRARRYGAINRSRHAEAVPFCERQSDPAHWRGKTAQQLVDELFN